MELKYVNMCLCIVGGAGSLVNDKQFLREVSVSLHLDSPLPFFSFLFFLFFGSEALEKLSKEATPQ